MRAQNKILGAAITIAAVLAACGFGQSRASADDSRLTVIPAVQRVSDSGNSGANVQLVQWGRPYGYGYGYRGYYRPYYGRAYYAAPHYGPYYAPVYGYPTYGGYGYTYPAYGYSYPAYGYPGYGGIGIRAGGVGVGIW